MSTSTSPRTDRSDGTGSVASATRCALVGGHGAPTGVATDSRIGLFRALDHMEP